MFVRKKPNKSGSISVQVIDKSSGSELLLGKLFDEIGFGQIEGDLFRCLVLARLCFPVSKLKTTDYLQK